MVELKLVRCPRCGEWHFHWRCGELCPECSRKLSPPTLLLVLTVLALAIGFYFALTA